MKSESTASIPYGIIADCLKSNSVVPFLGAAAAFAGAPPASALPSGKQFARKLASKSGYPGPSSDPLTKIAQFLEEVPADRSYLLNEIRSTFFTDVSRSYECAVTDFFSSMPDHHVPGLFITTNYDILLEKALNRRGSPFLVISHITKGSKFSGRYLCYSSLETKLSRDSILTKGKLEERILEFQEDHKNQTLIYKMHGTSRLESEVGRIDSIVLTENDYIDFIAHDLLNKLPIQIVKKLRKSRFLFLGYSLQDWNFRILLRRIQLIQLYEKDNQRKHWACLKSADEVEALFWERRGVNMYCIRLEEFLESLTSAVSGVSK